ncbi:alpha-ketoglutarate-dependent dioxygenase AlkB [Aquimarina sp. 2201CG5-10]|uniref:alpha-ketoglutarate-dependent dioxygenase AlkB n=1 Tax=Aquimarina callyspongiae TaxID=3098150 RepID=UPI002AB52B98|nr:alpha-ketoglutarate-dependent dioxygenase AlkB [Aquimarina sp. 2201CG5-10]MDY8137692.1 alpha-ketoglutarate-dependent dioxygenase AlkB [Aquimarina sp. 2201CG5-10]
MNHQLKDVIQYNNSFMSREEANKLFEHLMEYHALTRLMEMKTPDGTTFQHNFGKMMFLDKELVEEKKFPPSVWGNNMTWSKEIIPLKKRIENYTNNHFRTCVCIFYPDGNSGVDFHSDSTAFGDTSIIPSVSLGEERLFCLRDKKTNKENSMILKHGSLLIMDKGCQEHYEHSLPINPIYKKPRINLTFRKYGFDDQI